MPSTMIIKPRPVEAAQRPGPVRVKASSRAEAELKGSDVRKSRASSCTRGTQVRDRGQRATTEPQRSTSKPSCDRRVRSTSCAPKQAENGSRTNPNHRRATSCVRQTDNPKNRDTSGCPVQREQRASRTEPKVQIQSHKAFTVIPPNPKKRREIQKKAEAELAALEELRLSRATAYVSIDPSRVGGCMSLEEVRLKQQQEMMQAKRKHSQIKKQVMEETPARTR